MYISSVCFSFLIVFSFSLPFLKFKKCIYLFLILAELGVHCWVQAFSSCSRQGLFSSCAAQASCSGGFSCCMPWAPEQVGFSSCGNWAQQFQHTGSVVVACGLSTCGTWLSCSLACGIFQEQGSNLCPLYWQADSQPLDHQGSPLFLL